MRHSRAMVAGAGGLLTAAAHADIAIYSIAFGSPEGPNWVALEPGQSTSVFVNLWWSPGPTPGGALGLSNGTFSIIGKGSGAGSWTVNFNTASPMYHLPSPWGFQCCAVLGSYVTVAGMSVTGVDWGLGFLLTTNHPTPDNPATIWRATFTAAQPGNVNFTFSGTGLTGVFVTQGSSPVPAVANYPTTWFGAQVTVLPSPGPPALAAIAATALIPRRRRGTPAVRPAGPPPSPAHEPAAE